MLTTYYDQNGESQDESKASCAKKVIYEQRPDKHYIKRYTTFFNPYSADAAERRRGRYTFKVVNKDTFDYYLRFLNTGKQILLQHAERSV